MRRRVDRRTLLRSLSLLCLGGALGGAAPSSAGLTLPQFLRLSTLLTGFGPLDPEAGQRYLARLHRQPGTSRHLQVLYEQVGLTSAVPPTSLEEVSDERLFAYEETTLLADEIVDFWCEWRYRALSMPWNLISSSARRG